MDLPIQGKGVYRFGRFRMDLLQRMLWRDGLPVAIQPLPFEALAMLVLHHDRVVTRAELFSALWPGRVVEENNLPQAIATLRRLLRDETGPENIILTIPGRGYRMGVRVVLDTPDQPNPDAPPPVAAYLPGRLLVAAIVVSGLALLVSLIVWMRPVGETASPFAPPPHSVAVLAFANMTGDPKEAYFADGLADGLINMLSQVDALHVAARTSAFSFRGSTATIDQIARKLNVSAVLEGAMRRDGDVMHVSVQLVDARTGFPFWSHSYDGDRAHGDFLKLQTDIANEVVASVQNGAQTVDMSELALGGTHNARAFDAYLRGMDNTLPADDAHDHQAMADFSEAITLDAGYAEAYAGRANVTYRFGLAHGQAEQQRDDAAALADIAQALALEPRLAEAHRVKALILFGTLDFPGSAEEMARAIELSPGNARIESTYGLDEAILGHAAAALPPLQQAIARDPLNPRSFRMLGNAFFYLHRYADSLAAFAHADAMDTHLSQPKLTQEATTLLAQGHPGEALRLCIKGDDWFDHQCMAIAYHALGRQAEAEQQLAKVHDVLGDSGAYNYAVITAQFGRPDEALRWLQTAYTLKDPGLSELPSDPFLDPIRAQPAFQALITRLGLGSN